MLFVCTQLSNLYTAEDTECWKIYLSSRLLTWYEHLARDVVGKLHRHIKGRVDRVKPHGVEVLHKKRGIRSRAPLFSLSELARGRRVRHTRRGRARPRSPTSGKNDSKMTSLYGFNFPVRALLVPALQAAAISLCPRYLAEPVALKSQAGCLTLAAVTFVRAVSAPQTSSSSAGARAQHAPRACAPRQRPTAGFRMWRVEHFTRAPSPLCTAMCYAGAATTTDRGSRRPGHSAP